MNQGIIILASDDTSYFDAMRHLIQKEKSCSIRDIGILPNSSDPALRPPFWPMTRFEKKAHTAGRICQFLIAQKSISLHPNL